MRLVSQSPAGLPFLLDLLVLGRLGLEQGLVGAGEALVLEGPVLVPEGPVARLCGGRGTYVDLCFPLPGFKGSGSRCPVCGVFGYGCLLAPKSFHLQLCLVDPVEVGEEFLALGVNPRALAP